MGVKERILALRLIEKKNSFADFYDEMGLIAEMKGNRVTEDEIDMVAVGDHKQMEGRCLYGIVQKQR